MCLHPIDYCTRHILLSFVIAAWLNFIELVTFFTWKLPTENFVIFKNAGWIMVIWLRYTYSWKHILLKWERHWDISCYCTFNKFTYHIITPLVGTKFLSKHFFNKYTLNCIKHKLCIYRQEITRSYRKYIYRQRNISTVSLYYATTISIILCTLL